MPSSYRPDPTGLREFGRSPAVGQMCMDAAQRGAAWANGQHPAGKYEARPQVVPAGWNNEPRAGAVIEETGASGGRDRVLARAVNEVERG